MPEVRSPEIAGKLGWVLLGFLIFTVVLCLPISGLSHNGKVVLATAALMATWWVSEAVPIAVTALLPLVVLPLFGVLSATEVAKPYGNKNIFLFIGGFFIAKAMEKHGLHRRIALRILLLTGTRRRMVILGFMLATAFLSMWISNTATTMIMIPMALSVVANLDARGTRFATALFLSIAYSASIGGIGTLVGTPPNIVFIGQMRTMFPDAPCISFANWLVVGLPVVALMLPLAWFYLSFVAFRFGEGKRLSREYLRGELKALGKMSYEERVVFWVFLFTALGWIFRRSINLGFLTIPGWSQILGVEKYVHDSTVAILGALVLFIFPSRDGGRVLEWRTAVNIPWGIVLLFGGGFALAHSFGVAGVSKWIGSSFAGLGVLPVPLLIVLTSTLMTFLTEFTSNTATATLMLPILGAAAVGMRIDPRLIMIPATISDSCAFMLPVATPPNAIIFGSGQVRIKDMFRTGFFMNLMGIVVVLLVSYLIMIPAMGIDVASFPPWAQGMH